MRAPYFNFSSYFDSSDSFLTPVNPFSSCPDIDTYWLKCIYECRNALFIDLNVQTFTEECFFLVYSSLLSLVSFIY